MSDGTDAALKPPYVSFRAFKSALDDLRNLSYEPILVDRSLIKSVNGSAANEAISAMKFMGLLRNNGSPTYLYEKFVQADDASRRSELARMITDAYAFVFRSSGFDIQQATSDELERLFDASSFGESTKIRAISFFLSLVREAGIQTSPDLKTPPKQRDDQEAPRTIAEESLKVIKPAERVSPQVSTPIVPRAGVPQMPASQGNDVQRFEIPIPGKPSVSVLVPNSLDAEDWEMFQQMFQIYVGRWKRFGKSSEGQK